MTTPGSIPSSGQVPNRILRSLPPSQYEAIRPYLELVRFPMERIVHDPGQEMSHVYFPNHGVLSMLTVLENGDLIEMATVGNEGMADLSVFLGVKVARSRLLVQVPGDTLRMPREAFLSFVAKFDEFRVLLGHFMVAMFTLVSQSAACNRLHPVEERTARWLLMTHDRVDSDTFPITHDFFSQYARRTAAKRYAGRGHAAKSRVY